jgi:hypothetical protein
MAKNRLVFKKHPRPKGLAGIGSAFFIDIKINGKKCGIISGKGVFRKEISVQLSVKNSDEFGNKTWDWKFFYPKVEDELEAKEFVKSMIDEFVKNNEMHYFEKD